MGHGTKVGRKISLETFPTWKLIIIKLPTSKIYLTSLLIPSLITPHNYSARFQSFRSQAETQHLRFKSNNNESYNNLFSIEKLTDAISKAHDTAVGPDDIHYQMLKHLPNEACMNQDAGS